MNFEGDVPNAVQRVLAVSWMCFDLLRINCFCVVMIIPEPKFMVIYSSVGSA